MIYSTEILSSFSISAASVAFSVIGQVMNSPEMQGIGQLTFCGAACYACVHLYKALMAEKKAREEAEVRNADERTAIEVKHAEERKAENDRSAQAIADLHVKTIELLRSDLISGDQSRNDLILELRSLRADMARALPISPTASNPKTDNPNTA